jgi:quinol monooxygenase YgiN
MHSAFTFGADLYAFIFWLDANLPERPVPGYRDEVLRAVRENKLPTRADKGVEAYYQTARKDDPNTLLFFAVFSSQQEHAKRTYAAFQGKLAQEPVLTELVELE